MGIPEKPDINVEEFVKSSKTEKFQKVGKPNKTAVKKDKTFLLKLHYSLWKKLKKGSLSDDKTLHQYIIDILSDHVRQAKE